MGSITTGRITFEEFERMPDQPGKQELLEGELIELPPAEFRHNIIGHRILECLKAVLAEAHARGEALELGEVYHEMGYKLPGQNYVQPDVSVTHAGQSARKYLEGAPAIAIEVVSPGNTVRQIEAKTELYFRHGAREVWRLYDKTRRVIVRVGATSRTVLENEAVTTPLLPGLSLSVREILS